jgi:ATP-dependent DNA helicase DinG
VGGTPRDGQAQMAHEVASALDGGEALLIQAGTGTGKSLAYLVPAFLHALQSEPVVVATATLALQRQLSDRDAPAVMRALRPLVPRDLRAAVLKGRHNYLCRLRLSPVATESADEEMPLWTDDDRGAGRLTRQAAAVRAWAERTSTGDRDDLPEPVDGRVWRAVSVTATECVGRQRCDFGDECFAEAARDAARDADVVITNHAMLALELVEGLPVLPEHDAVIIDEGHEWIERATAAATLSLSASEVESLATSLRRVAESAATDLADAATQFDGALEELREGAAAEEPVRITGASGRLAESAVILRAAARAALGALPAADAEDGAGASAARQRLRAGLDAVVGFCDRIAEAGAAQVLWISGRPATLRIAPLSIADVMGGRIFGRGLVVTSATLGDASTQPPFVGLARDLGVANAPWRGLDVGSPFDFATQGILYVAAHLPEPGRGPIDEAVLDEMAELMEAAGGRTLALFSSWRGVERAAEYLAVRLTGDWPLLVQQRGDAVGPLVEAFRAEPESILLGTVSLWQGVDVPGDACRLVIIDRIPFTRPDDPVLAARSEAADSAGGSGFSEVALPRAAMLLAQGVGRLIRSHDDRGVVAVCDPRLVTKGYGRRLRQAIPPMWRTQDPDVVRAALRRLNEHV